MFDVRLAEISVNWVHTTVDTERACKSRLDFNSQMQIANGLNVIKVKRPLHNAVRSPVALTLFSEDWAVFPVPTIPFQRFLVRSVPWRSADR